MPPKAIRRQPFQRSRRRHDQAVHIEEISRPEHAVIGNLLQPCELRLAVADAEDVAEVAGEQTPAWGFGKVAEGGEEVWFDQEAPGEEGEHLDG